MTLYLLPDKKVLWPVTRLAQTPAARMRGLMFISRTKADFGLIFEFPQTSTWGASIHMLFVFFPIDAVYLDEQKKVVDIGRNLKPFSLGYSPKTPSRYLIEIATDYNLKVKIGDQLDWP